MASRFPPPQAPSEAEAATDLIDMGPESAATGGLSSQLAGMSKYGAPLPFCGCPPVTRLELGHHQQNLSPDPTSPQCPKLTLATRWSAQGKTHAPQLLGPLQPQKSHGSEIGP